MPKIHELMTSPAKWTRGTMGRDSRGKPIRYIEELDQACRCCAVGWIFKVYSNKKKARCIMDKVRKKIKSYFISAWNDNATFKEVHAVFKELDL